MNWDPYAIPVDNISFREDTIRRGDSVTYSCIDPVNGKMFYASSKVSMLTKSGIIYLENGSSFKVDGNENTPGIERRHKTKFLEGLTSTVEKRLPKDELSPSTLAKIIEVLKYTYYPSGDISPDTSAKLTSIVKRTNRKTEEPPCQPPPAT